jgi:CO/xanthine dehydrogenase FAD-binding subunit
MNETFSCFCPREYFKPTAIDESVEILNRYGEAARPIAGGTDLMVEKDPGISVLVDVTGLGLDYVTVRGDGVSIGAAALIAAIADATVLREGSLTIIAEAARGLGTPQIRNMATIGGNICRPSPAADMAPPLLALGAKIKIAGKNGLREVAAEQFFVGVKQDALQPGEIVTEIFVPLPAKRTGAALIKKGRVAVGDLSIVSVAVVLTLGEDGSCCNARIALGAVAPVPMRVAAAEQLLKGQIPGQELLARAAEQASKEIKPITDVRASGDYRRVLSRVLVERALKQALEQVA